MTLRPAVLRAGDRVAVVSPSSPPFPDRLEAGLDALRGWGLEPLVTSHARDVHGHLAGPDADRIADLEAAFRDPDVHGVLVGRGGFGAARLLDALDWTAVAEHPKPLVGFSDVTALLLAAWRRVGLVAVHGQFVGRLHLLDRRAARHLRRLLTEPVAAGRVPGDPDLARTVHPGTGEGILLGGNLATLCSLVGTADQPDLDGALLFLEEVNEAPYRLDRMLTQLRRAGVLAGVAGVVVARLVGCDPPTDRPSMTADEVVDERLGALGVPVVHGLEIGHSDRQLALPTGVRARLDADARTLELLEPAFRPR